MPSITPPILKKYLSLLMYSSNQCIFKIPFFFSQGHSEILEILLLSAFFCKHTKNHNIWGGRSLVERANGTQWKANAVLLWMLICGFKSWGIGPVSVFKIRFLLISRGSKIKYFVVFATQGEGLKLWEVFCNMSYKQFCNYSTLIEHLPPFAETASLKI